LYLLIITSRIKEENSKGNISKTLTVSCTSEKSFFRYRLKCRRMRNKTRREGKVEAHHDARNLIVRAD